MGNVGSREGARFRRGKELVLDGETYYRERVMEKTLGGKGR